MAKREGKMAVRVCGTCGRLFSDGAGRYCSVHCQWADVDPAEVFMDPDLLDLELLELEEVGRDK